jgi:acetoin utilization deacetylase AcuC-like enzyme
MEPEWLTEESLTAIHSSDYVNAVKTGMPRHLAESSGFPWDLAVWDAVRASNGGAVAAALHALTTRRNAGSLSSGLHHARRDSGAGFCTFNGLALAARAALEAGARRVLILDLDAHIGDGTFDIVSGWIRVTHVDISVSAWAASDKASAPETGGDPPRSSLDVITNAADYLLTLRRRLDTLDTSDVDLCIYNAGMDPHEDCEIGHLKGITTPLLRRRERMVFRWAANAGVPVAFVAAGGYSGGRLSREALVDLHRMTIAEAVRGGRPRDAEGCYVGEDGRLHDASFHEELLGPNEDDPFAFDIDTYIELSPELRKRFLEERHSQPTPNQEFLEQLLEEPLTVRLGVLTLRESQSVPPDVQASIEENTRELRVRYGDAFFTIKRDRHRRDLALAYGVVLDK